ncbi:MAG: YARHG domain-containing protein [Bacteroidales bacterium]|nr:YARHG domain-containing protein [Bacteroidales bacterium]
MKKLLTILLAVFAFATVKANDGAFYARGNQLIPITETTISVKKEILTITRHADTISNWGSMFKVNVYYEFFNPGPAKDLLVGFESPSPDGNAYGGTLDEAYAGQPFIYDFSVAMNGKRLPYQLAHVPYKYEGNYQFDYTMDTKDYYKNGRIQDMSKAQYKANLHRYFPDEDDVEESTLEFYGYLFYYVYHFNGHFNEGLNTIQHTYTLRGSDLVMMDYLFDYILTAANRWANNGIDDFTLILNMGDRESFSVSPTFFETPDEWSFSGKGRIGGRSEMMGMCENCSLFHVQSGSVMFRKRNFHPEGELHISSTSYYYYDFVDDDEKVDDDVAFAEEYKTQYYDLYINKDYPYNKKKYNDEQQRILKNMPFAYRGYVFKDKGLQRFFESSDWYVPNPDYQADMTKLSKSEREWVQFWTK